MTDRTDVGASAPAHPVRTCIGCRQRALDSDLLRVVTGGTGTAGSTEAVSVRPDPRRRASGRGAWVHPDLACVDLAIRRRAFGRALRATVPMDPAPVREYVSGTIDTARRSTQDRTTHTVEQDTTSGTPQEMTSYGHSMKRQQ